MEASGDGETLSEDLRGRVIAAAAESGASRRAAAERFGIGVVTAIRWVRVFRATGTVSAQPMGGDLRSHRIEAFRDVVLSAIEAQKDITLAELVTLLRREHGTGFAISTVHRHLVRHRITLKKSRARRRAGAVGRGAQATGLVRRAA